jgi:hypothetical protein
MKLYRLLHIGFNPANVSIPLSGDKTAEFDIDEKMKASFNSTKWR